MMKKILLILSIVAYNNTGFSQSQHSGWLATFNTFKTGKHTSIHNDIQWRSADEFSGTQSYLIRAGLNVALKKNLIVTAGYAYVSNRRTIQQASALLPEHRIWQQVILNHEINKRIFTAHRFRLEQRFLSVAELRNNEVVKTDHELAHRARYFIRNILPIKKTGQFTEGAFVALQNEVFLNIGSKSAVNGKTFDQNRLYLSVGYRFSKQMDLEAGYLNQYISRRNQPAAKVHVAQLATYFRL